MSYRLLGQTARGYTEVPTRDVLEYVKALGFAFLAGAAATVVVVSGARALREMRPNLSKSARAALPDSAFAIPERRSFPVHTQKQAKAAIAYLHMGRIGSAADFARVRSDIIRRYGADFWRAAGGPTWPKAQSAKRRRAATLGARSRATRKAA